MKCLAWMFCFCFLTFVIADKRAVTDKNGTAVGIKANLSTLIHVHAMWRHGDRTPIVLLPNDTANDEKSWEIGLGELTAIGIGQAFRLGKFLRQRYSGFLSDDFKTSEIYVRSTDFNRTLMTAVAILQGLFPRKHNDSGSLIWHPIPVHTVQAESDSLLIHYCPKAEQELRLAYKMKAVQSIVEMNDGLLRYIGEHIGSIASNVFENIWSVYDPLEVITHHKDKHRFPKWVNETIWNKILRLYDLFCQIEYSSDLLKKLRGGKLLQEILTRLGNLQTQKLPWKQKMYAYSAHDETLAMLLSVLGVEVTSFPPYAAVVLLEMHRVNGQFFLQLFYKNVTDSNLIYRLPIGFCDDLCSLEKLKESTRKFIPMDWELECGLSMPYKKIGPILSLLLVLNVLAVLLCHFMKSFLKRKKKYGDRALLSGDSEMNVWEKRTLLTDQQ